VFFGLQRLGHPQKRPARQQRHLCRCSLAIGTVCPDPARKDLDNQETQMDIKPTGSRPSEIGSAEYFTGSVRLDPVVSAPEPARIRAATVTFEPGARTAWHTHPLGQTLLVLSGTGLAQTQGGPVKPLRPGDTVWFAPGEKHWHGAAPDCAMTHLAIQEALDGKAVDWLDHVTDEQYGSQT
jgi:quercetin dioxygenase-like cupin family protein